MEGPLSHRLGPEATLVVRMALDPFPTRVVQSLTGLGSGRLPFTQRSHLRPWRRPWTLQGSSCPRR